MRILLAQRLPWFPALSGDTKFNRGVLEGLARRHHSCRVVALAGAKESPESLDCLRRELEDRGTRCTSSSSEADVYQCNGIEIHVVSDGYGLLTHFANQIREFDPTCILVSEDRTFLTLATALKEAGATPVIFLAYSQATLPFGPECFLSDAAKTAVLRRATRIVTPNHYIRDYVSRWSDVEADVLPIPAYGDGPFPSFGRHDEGFVTLVNPAQIKGLCVFEHLASALPDVEFAAVPTWATTNDDLQRLRHLRNVSLRPPAVEIDEILSRTRVLLVPSLWGEGVGLIVVEAMLRGIPVLASNIGGLPESKLGIDYLLPVRPIERYLAQTDGRGLPIPIVPEQDVGPWLDALSRLLSDAPHYRELSAASRSAALAHVSGLGVVPFEQFLERHAIARAQSVPQRPDSFISSAPGTAQQPDASSSLSRERLEVLAALLKRDQR